jgi:hypothetical protein
MAADLTRAGTDDLAIAGTLLAGRWQLHVGREQVRATLGMALLASQRGELRASWDDVNLNVVALDRHLLSQVASQITRGDGTRGVLVVPDATWWMGRCAAGDRVAGWRGGYSAGRGRHTSRDRAGQCGDQPQCTPVSCGRSSSRFGTSSTPRVVRAQKQRGGRATGIRPGPARRGVRPVEATTDRVTPVRVPVS